MSKKLGYLLVVIFVFTFINNLAFANVFLKKLNTNPDTYDGYDIDNFAVAETYLNQLSSQEEKVFLLGYSEAVTLLGFAAEFEFKESDNEVTCVGNFISLQNYIYNYHEDYVKSGVTIRKKYNTDNAKKVGDTLFINFLTPTNLLGVYSQDAVFVNDLMNYSGMTLDTWGTMDANEKELFLNGYIFALTVITHGFIVEGEDGLSFYGLFKQNIINSGGTCYDDDKDLADTIRFVKFYCGNFNFEKIANFLDNFYKYNKDNKYVQYSVQSILRSFNALEITDVDNYSSIDTRVKSLLDDLFIPLTDTEVDDHILTSSKYKKFMVKSSGK